MRGGARHDHVHIAHVFRLLGGRDTSVTLMLVMLLIGALVAGPPGLGGDRADAQETRRQGTLDVVRYAGTNRFDTARQIATQSGLQAPDFQTDTVLVARADTFPDSLAGSYLAGVLDAPVLLTDPEISTEPFEQALSDLNPSNLVLLGGNAAISDDLAQSLRQDHDVVRVAGAGRYATAAEIARNVSATEHDGLAVLASGEDFPDALTAGAIAAGEQIPLLLTAQATLPPPTEQALDDLGISEVLLAGGAAAVSATVEQRIEDLGITVTRVAGPDRFATARAIGELAVQRFGWRDDHVNLTSGLDFPDAVAMTAHAGLEAGGPAPIALTADVLPPATDSWLRSLAACDMARVDIAGGTAAVPGDVADAAIAALNPGGCDDESPPTISFTDPADGATLTRTQDGIELQGTANDDETGVRKIELYVGDQLVGSTTGDRSTSDPLRWTVPVFPPQAQTYTFEAVATDGAGLTASDTLTLTVEARDPGETVPDDDAQPLDDGILDYDSDSGDLVLDGQPAGDPVLPGDTVVCGITPATPEGCLRNVVTAREDGDGRIRLQTGLGDFTDVFRQVDLRLERPYNDLSDSTDDDPSDGVTLTEADGLPPGDETKLDVTPGPRSDFTSASSARTTTSADGARQPADGSAKTPDKTRSVSKTWTLNVQKSFFQDSLQLQATNEFGVAVRFRLQIKTEFDWFNSRVYVNRFKLVGAITEDLDLSATAKAGLSHEQTIKIKTVDLPTIQFQAGPFPVILTSDIIFDLVLKGQAEAEVTTGAHGHFELAAGTRYKDGDGWSPVNRIERSWTTDPIRARADASAEAFLRAGIGIRLYDAVGPRFTVGPFVRGEIGTERNPLWSIFAGFRGILTLEGRIPVIGIKLAGVDFDLFTFDREIASAEDYPPPPPEDPTPPGVKIISPSSGTVGCCDVLLQADTESPATDDDEELFVEYSSDIDGALPGGFGAEPVRATLSPGTHTITATLEARNSDGTFVTVTDEIAVEVLGSRQPNEQFAVTGTSGANDLAAGLLGIAFKDGEEAFLDGAEFLTAPPAPGGERFLGTVENTPGGIDDSAVILTTGNVDDADTRNEADEEGTELGGGDVGKGGTERDVIVWALHLRIPEHGNCLVFDHRFLSEEVPRFVGSEYNDAFVAEVHPTADVTGVSDLSWSVSGSELSAPDTIAFGPGPFPSQVNASTGIYVKSSNAFETTYASGHPLMRAATPVTPDSDQTLVLSLFDQGDLRYDSAVLLDNLQVIQVPDPASDCVGGVAPDGLSLTTAN